MSAQLRDLESSSIRAFVQRCADDGLLSGRVLDFGAGRQPYRSIIEGAGGEYVPYDRIDNPGSVAHTDLGPDVWWREGYDAILATQVFQYLPLHARCSGDHYGDTPGPCLESTLYCMELVAGGSVGQGSLVATGPLNWPLTEPNDEVSRFTPKGMGDLLTASGFREVGVEERGQVAFQGEHWVLGWSAVARA